ncbi:hypothetical protein F4820DRAFT_443183 [Hypoxylon rubiginosum]|uniref:Uncharacterized protein n=1 Tax=Hypoxylon rubiginosum TaxID=110542 RepID=A0ACB9ZHN9_9PEZI|nr:hypothetical protein F4820DRAFT_443183 [Hypoxylon rubiginosum]
MSNSATPSYAQAAKGQSTVQSSGSQSSATESQAPSTTSTQSRDAAPTPSTRAPSVAISTTSNEVDGSQNTRSSSVKPESLSGIDTDSVSTGDKAGPQSNLPAQGTEKALSEMIPQGTERRGRGRGQTLTSQATDAGDGKKTRKARKGKGAEKESEQSQDQDRKDDITPKQELSDAPLPTVNPWAQRAAKFTAASSTTTPSRNPNDTAPGQQSTTQEYKQRPAQNDGVDTPASHSRALSGGVKGTKKDTEQPRSNGNQSSRRTAPRGFRGPNGEDRAGYEALGPAASNTLSWPTPESAANDLKAQVNAEKPEREKKEETGPSKPRQKEKWVHVPYVPTVAFETPLPSRGGRGGRGGGSRGGRDGATRNNHATNESSPTDRAQENGVAPGSASAAASKRQSVDISTSREGRKPLAQPTAGKTSGEISSANSKVDVPKQNLGDQVPGITSPTNSVRAGSSNQRAEESSKPSQSVRENGVHHLKDPGFQGQNGSNRSDRARGGARGRGGHSVSNGIAHTQSQYTQGSVGYGYSTNPSLRQPNYGYTQMSYGGPFQGQTTGNHHRSRPSSGNNRSQGGGRHQSSRTGSFPPVGMYEPAYPHTSTPYGYSDPQHILHVIGSQMDYYFSIDNLCKDTYLRQHMDSQGFVPLAVITAFKRMQNIAQDYQVVRVACEHSPHVQLVVTETGEDKVRRRDKWEPWVLDMHLRHPTAQNDGPTAWHPWSSQLGYYPHVFAYGSEAAPMFSPAGTDTQQFSPYVNGNGVTSPTTNGVNGHAYPSESQLSATVPEFSPTAVSGMGTASQKGFVAANTAGDELANGTSLTNGTHSHENVEPVSL